MRVLSLASYQRGTASIESQVADPDDCLTPDRKLGPVIVDPPHRNRRCANMSQAPSGS